MANWSSAPTASNAQLFTVDKNQPVGQAMKHKYPIAAAAFSADGKRVVTVFNEPRADEAEGLAQVWDAATGEAVGPVLQHIRPLSDASFSPDGQKVMTACADFRVRVYETTTGKLVGKAIDHNPAVAMAKFSPDGKFVFTATISGVMKPWDTATGEQSGPTTHARCAAHPDGLQQGWQISADRGPEGKCLYRGDGREQTGVQAPRAWPAP